MQKPEADGAVLYGPAGVQHSAGALGTDDRAPLVCRHLTVLLWPCCTQSSWPVRHAKPFPSDSKYLLCCCNEGKYGDCLGAAQNCNMLEPTRSAVMSSDSEQTPLQQVKSCRYSGVVTQCEFPRVTPVVLEAMCRPFLNASHHAFNQLCNHCVEWPSLMCNKARL